MPKKKSPAKRSKLSRLLGVPDTTLLKDLREPGEGSAGAAVNAGTCRVPTIQVTKKIPRSDGMGLASDGTTFCDYLQEYVSFDRDKLLDDIDAIRRGIIAEGMDQTVFQPGGHILVLRRKRAT